MVATGTRIRYCSDRWSYPIELRGDLEGAGLTADQIDETLACAWEYVRSVIPQFTNWERYLAHVRLVVLAVVAEYRGDLIETVSDGPILGYDVDDLLGILFGGTAYHEDMAREFRSFLLITSQKSAMRGNSLLLRSYAEALAHSPEDWHRLRDCDALARFFIAAAMTCNDITGPRRLRTNIRYSPS